MLNNLNFVYFIDGNNLNLTLIQKSLETLIKFYDINLLIIFYENENTRNVLNERINELKDKYCNYFSSYFKYVDSKIASMILKPKCAINRGYLGNNTLIRFFLPYLLDCDNVYWVDNDILFNNNYSHELLNINPESTLMKCWAGRYEQNGSIVEEPINCGFMYINCKMWKNIPDIMINILKYYIDNHDTIKYMNQSCYTYLITEKYKDLCILENNKLINVYIKLNTVIDKAVYIYHACGSPHKLEKMDNAFKQIVNGQ